MAQSSIIVAIDGPAGAGKSTVAKEVARALDFALVDTGALYRAVALLADRQHIALDDDVRLMPVVDGLDVVFRLDGEINRVFVAGEDVTHLIRSSKISNGAALVSARQKVRAGLLALQRRLAGEGGAVLEGRDIGTVVCPDAAVKIFLHASLKERARRRYEELVKTQESADMQQVLREVDERDQLDQSRTFAPLRAADDAEHLDCTTLSAQHVIDHIVARTQSIINIRMQKSNEMATANAFDDAVVAFVEKTLPLRLQLHPELHLVSDATYKIVVSGKETVTWLIRVEAHNKRVKVKQVTQDVAAISTLTLDMQTFAAIIAGKQNPQLAFMAGKLRVVGDMGLALRFAALLA